MPAIDNLMKRLGFVKLADYGLVLTPEGRIISMRPAVLDDGFGGRIVGWEDGDLAAAELEKWEPARPASKQAAATRLAAPPVPLSRHTAPMPVVARPLPARVTQPVAVVAAPAPAPVAIAAPAPAKRASAPVITAPAVAAAPIVAPAPVVEEDDWEWTIAIARARSAADDVQEAVATARSSQRRMRADTVPPPVTISAKDPIAEDEWPTTQPLTDLDYNDYSSPAAHVVRAARTETPRAAKGTPAPFMATAAPAPTRPVLVASPTTVIPVPRMPTIGNARIEPVVRPPIVATNPPQRRFAKGTGPHHPNTVSRTAHTDDTVPGFVLVEPANEDTVPAIAITPAAKAAALPSIKRVMRG